MNVYEAINEVMSDLCAKGISKAQTNKQQGFKFRGIDDVYNSLSRSMSDHGLSIIPRVLEREVTEKQTRNGGNLFYVCLKVEYDIVSIDGSSHKAQVFAEAMDSGDKATSKAMSAAYKYLCLQVFCIPTEGDNDADATTHDVKSTLQAAIDEHQDSISVIKESLARDDLHGAAEAWYELDDETKRALWVAPSKGGPFTTQERQTMQTKEFREAK